MLRLVKCLLVLTVLLISADVFAASTTQYVAKFKLGKGNSTTGTSLQIIGKGIDLYSLWNLSLIATAKGSTTTTTAELGVFTSNGNTRVVFFSNDVNNQITTNGNFFVLKYSVKVDKKGTAKAQSDKSISKPSATSDIGVSFTALNNGNSSKSKFKFLIMSAQMDAAAALLPKTGKGKKNLPSLVGTTNFTVQIGSATFVAKPDGKGNVKFSQ
jgi:hypothetical protein